MKILSKFSILGIIFLICILPINLKGQESNHTDLWNIIQKDTFPFLRSYEGIYKAADASLLPVLLLKSGKKVDHNAIAQAYYYNLLAGRFAVCDSIISDLSPSDSSYLNLLGHIALKEYVPCFGIQSPGCDSVRNAVYPLLKEAAEKSNLMPAAQWKWMASVIDGTQKLSNSKIELIPVEDSLENVSAPSWEGAIIQFKLKPEKQNLLISNGPRKPLQILELDSNQHWTDISISSGVNLIPGGHLVYNVDYNVDGLDDIFILRKSSDQRSPAKYFSSLLLNNGDGTFKDISKEKGLDNIRRPMCACWDDINQDGRPDVFIGDEFTPSTWMIQKEDGSFENHASGFNILTNRMYIQGCLLTDFNNDGLKDLYLSLRRDSNRLYIQEPINKEYFYFKDQAEKYDLKVPAFSSEFIAFDFGLDGQKEILIQSDYLDIHQIIADVLNGKDTIDAEPSLFFTILNDTTYKYFTQPEIPLIKAGVILEYPENSFLLSGGGKNTEALYPMFVFEFNKKEHSTSISIPDRWPAYVHSATAYADSLDQPVIVFKGGGAYPFMVNRQVSYQVKMPEPGKFVRLFEYSNAQIGTLVTFDYYDKEGNVKKLSREIQTLDSKGYSALQEWLWTPEGCRVENIQYAKKATAAKQEKQPAPEAPSKSKKGKKSKKK